MLALPLLTSKLRVVIDVVHLDKHLLDVRFVGRAVVLLRVAEMVDDAVFEVLVLMNVLVLDLVTLLLDLFPVDSS